MSADDSQKSKYGSGLVGYITISDDTTISHAHPPDVWFERSAPALRRYAHESVCSRGSSLFSHVRQRSTDSALLSGCNLRQGPRVGLTGEGLPGSTCEKESAERIVQATAKWFMLPGPTATAKWFMETSPIVSPISCTVTARLWWQGLVCVSGGTPHYPHKPSIAKTLVRRQFRLLLRLCGGCQ
ncbi:hypothetical protein P692DRAFT_20882276 [Suillus brevipes Sb2]|nr:hypothetical protein P692DRAFT_20882276 [Suillus brevipes Sb2]